MSEALQIETTILSDTTVKPECLNATETRASPLGIRKKRKENLKKILELRKISANKLIFYLSPNQELCETFDEISTTIKVNRIALYGHIGILETSLSSRRIVRRRRKSFRI